MSITDFLFSLHKLLVWLFALLTVLLPQHLLAPLAAKDAPSATYAAPQPCVQTPAPPRKLARAVLPALNANEADVSASTTENPDAATAAPQTKR